MDHLAFLLMWAGLCRENVDSQAPRRTAGGRSFCGEQTPPGGWVGSRLTWAMQAPLRGDQEPPWVSDAGEESRHHGAGGGFFQTELT